MKNIKTYMFLCATLLLAAGCDQDFVEINTNPYAVTKVDPALLFAGGQRNQLGTWAAEHTIVQHFVCPYNTGANVGFNFNQDIDEMSFPKWNDSYPGPVRALNQALTLLGENTPRVNLRNMIRIWKAQVFMALVDAYGNIPYFQAGQAYSGSIYYPVYNDDEEIYEDLYKEITTAMASLDPAGDFVAEDLFYGAHGKNATTTPADQVAKWKKLGNSLLLRMGMRYSKIDENKAESIVQEAFNGGVMTSNADNAYVKYDGTGWVHAENNNLRNFSYFNYAAEPFVDQLKATNDPRAKYMIGTFDDPGAISNDLDPDTVLANQFGVPIGITSAALGDPNGAYRGPRGGGLNYSQINVLSVGSPAAPDFYVTYAQTSLLLAEAAQRGWITTGDAQTYYEDGIRADMLAYAQYPRTNPISLSEINTYLDQPEVDFSLATTDEEAFELINTQYWVVNFRNGNEAFANFRRSGYPALSRNAFNNNLMADGGDGFAHRLSYPNAEGSSNSENYLDASSKMGGDKLTSRVFWDVE